MSITFQAFLTGIALIAAIGAQNIFIIKEGLRGGFVYTAALISASCDAILIGIGIIVVSEISKAFVWFKDAMLWAAVVFLIYYAYTLALNAFRAKPSGWFETEDVPHGSNSNGRYKTIRLALMFSLFNPHVYLDTFVVLGGMGASQHGLDRFLFWLGGAMASFAWFLGTGHLAARLAPLLKSERAGRTIDAAIAGVVLLLAAQLIKGAI